MAKKKTETPETPEDGETRKVSATVTRSPDRVAIVSRRVDGSPDQRKGYEVIDDHPERR